MLCILSKRKLFAQNVVSPFRFLKATTTTTLNRMTFSVLGKKQISSTLGTQILFHTSRLISHSYRTTKVTLLSNYITNQRRFAINAFQKHHQY
ncbi:uncharacterized protein Gasu_54010 [Galdieria sulphuraria]|uniref:Uncharacterized protein n=1 Tax=Galdieria sulphuraria TaxID=130081 RepID=M2XAZ3_GALSU|nr:uncharacterized protein Gasu_54010 [Galdieria sulphuraria]EME27067.1 hypothetical protein Gasu_54010 [Galdieria sulphuraria]|eukprot:XP_005703587.1 hypothetical protein Gasu_54010 [Galdieria sulphuraria]